MHPQTNKTALLVEDELFIVLELEETLQKLGYGDVAVFSSVELALSWLSTSTPDIAIIDYHLKDDVADKLIRTLVEASVPTVIYSGHSLDPDTEHGILSECEWLTKPADERMLAAAIARAYGF
jgi:DNA-binding response OmpR family regulator